MTDKLFKRVLRNSHLIKKVGKKIKAVEKWLQITAFA
jgi:hypothetical protein